MSDAGWIKVHRALRKHWLSGDLEKMGAWLFLLMSASHRDTEFVFDGELVPCERGAFITSKRKLAQIWGWSREKTELFLTTLETNHMITSKPGHRHTKISIVNWDTYQGTDGANQATDQATNQATNPHQSRNLRRSRIDNTPQPPFGGDAPPPEPPQPRKRKPKAPKYLEFAESDFTWPAKWGERAKEAMRTWVEFKAKDGTACLLESYQGTVEEFADRPREFAALVTRAKNRGWRGLNEHIPFTGMAGSVELNGHPAPAGVPRKGRLHPSGFSETFVAGMALVERLEREEQETEVGGT